MRPYVVGSAIDLQNAYFQVELAPKLHHCFGVCLRRKFYVYERLPFGYVNSPSEFLRALRPAIAEMDEAVQSQVVVYMDDILLLSQSVSARTSPRSTSSTPDSGKTGMASATG